MLPATHSLFLSSSYGKSQYRFQRQVYTCLSSSRTNGTIFFQSPRFGVCTSVGILSRAAVGRRVESRVAFNRGKRSMGGSTRSVKTPRTFVLGDIGIETFGS